jgi:hypothetical protein
MADEEGLPASPGTGKGPGWYPVWGVNDQAYWDGEHWTARRRWTGASWTESPLDAAPDRTEQEGGGSTGSSGSRRWLLIGGIVLVLAAGLAAGLVAATSGSTKRSNATAPSGSSTVPSSAPTTSAVTVPHQSEAVVAACQSDARSLEVALEAYMAQNGSFPTPPSPWNAATYAGNFAPLTSSSHGGPYMHEPLAPTNYVIEYDSSGNVWVAPPGSYGASYNPGQGFDQHPDICLAAAR